MLPLFLKGFYRLQKAEGLLDYAQVTLRRPTRPFRHLIQVVLGLLAQL